MSTQLSTLTHQPRLKGLGQLHEEGEHSLKAYILLEKEILLWSMHNECLLLLKINSPISIIFWSVSKHRYLFTLEHQENTKILYLGS